MRFICLACLLCLAWATAQAQEKKKDKKKADEELSLENDTLPNMEYRLVSDSVRKAEMNEYKKRRSGNKKKREKKIYFDIKTKSTAVRKEGSADVLEIVQYIPITYLRKDNYQQAIFYLDAKSRKVKSDNYQNLATKLKKGAVIYLLHGKYQRYKNGELETVGYYYKGLTHDLWRKYDKNFILLEKLTYHMGHSAEARITYYDAEEQKPKEIIPVEHKILQGLYYRFHENGAIAETGEYANGAKVDMWVEYYDNRQKKKQTQHTPEYTWHTPQEPYTVMEWDKYGKVTFDYKKDKDKK